MPAKYKPISCHFYDELELLAIRQTSCPILYYNETNQQLATTDIIVDFKIINHAEFMLLKSGLQIRLDRIISVDGKELAGYC